MAIIRVRKYVRYLHEIILLKFQTVYYVLLLLQLKIERKRLSYFLLKSATRFLHNNGTFWKKRMCVGSAFRMDACTFFCAYYLFDIKDVPKYMDL